ncbi:hypothetical protein SCLCIDRAFT_1211052 [Scleroderma citrinum Foug A]|uniref:Uncharacterized protein n=1 Tax=Scleroderma citrinum Foug A TaxID=1036808 RepID=A0A0C3EFC8_9AGAM|nr:hypothetical protein SCLCIDRAFT_1211052 [Scleroderma citrinum Foug A]
MANTFSSQMARNLPLHKHFPAPKGKYVSAWDMGHVPLVISPGEPIYHELVAIFGYRDCSFFIIQIKIMYSNAQASWHGRDSQCL